MKSIRRDEAASDSMRYVLCLVSITIYLCLWQKFLDGDTS